MYPADFRYSKDHEWVKIEGGTGTVGITDYAQSELGDVVFVEAAESRHTTKRRADDRHDRIRESRERSL